jgi:hypothetical protein
MISEGYRRTYEILDASIIWSYLILTSGIGHEAASKKRRLYPLTILPINEIIIVMNGSLSYTTHKKSTFSLFRAESRQLQFGIAELPKATGNRQQATGNRQQATGNT